MICIQSESITFAFKLTTSSKNNVSIHYIGFFLFLNKDQLLMSGLLCYFKG